MSSLTRRNLRRTFQNLQRGLQGQQSRANQQRNFDRLMRGLQGLPEPLAAAARARAPLAQQGPAYREPILVNGPNLRIPSGSTNTISMNNISSGNSMVDFHNEYRHDRFYKEKNLPLFTKNRNGFPLNPITRERITNATRYKASVLAGGRRKTRRRRSMR